jgi:hypothetical protein
MQNKNYLLINLFFLSPLPSNNLFRPMQSTKLSIYQLFLPLLSNNIFDQCQAQNYLLFNMFSLPPSSFLNNLVYRFQFTNHVPIIILALTPIFNKRTSTINIINPNPFHFRPFCRGFTVVATFHAQFPGDVETRGLIDPGVLIYCSSGEKFWTITSGVRGLIVRCLFDSFPNRIEMI